MKISIHLTSPEQEVLVEHLITPGIDLEFKLLSEQSLAGGELLYDKDGLHVYSFDSKEKNWKIDFVQYLQQWKRQQLGLKKELLSRSLGIKGEVSLRVGDFTCGSGKDASMLMFWKQKVLAFERNPQVFLLLKDALERLKNDENFSSYASFLKLHFGNGIHQKQEIDVAYYDPMFFSPHAKQKAKGRKEMEVFKKLVGDDRDDRENLETLRSFYKRIVVKRGDKHPSLHEDINQCWKGKTVRYDMYLGR